MNPVAIGATILCVTCLAGALWCEEAGRQKLLYLFKPLASTGFLTVALTTQIWGRAYPLAIFVALVFSFWGDVFLMWRTRPAFLAGLVSFLLGHVAFAAAFALAGLDLTWLAGGFVVAIAAGVPIARWLLPSVDGPMKAPVVAYMTIISLMVALSIGHYGVSGHWYVPLGAIAFYASDISVARDRFVARTFRNRLWGLPTYYSAQLIFAWGIVLTAPAQ